MLHGDGVLWLSIKNIDVFSVDIEQMGKKNNRHVKRECGEGAIRGNFSRPVPGGKKKRKGGFCFASGVNGRMPRWCARFNINRTIATFENQNWK